MEYRSFVNHSVEQLRSSGFKNRSVINIIKFHCERFDGSGFPKGCAGNRIPMLASVVGIATEFDRLCNSREAGDTMVPSKATSRLYQLRGSAFAENLVVEFIQSVGLYPAGTMVELTTGDQGMVIEQNPRSRLAPRLAVFKNRMDRADQGKYIFIDLKNESAKQLSNYMITHKGLVSKCFKWRIRFVGKQGNQMTSWNYHLFIK